MRRALKKMIVNQIKRDNPEFAAQEEKRQQMLREIKAERRGKPRKAEKELDRTTDAITPAVYEALQQAYDHFNRELFDGSLPTKNVVLTFQRKANSAGYFSANRFSGRGTDSKYHELALNPDAFIGKSDKQNCQTLVHEMAHVWQEEQGTAPKRGYHNKEWAAKMKSIGLQPSSTGAVGGNETGQKMSDYIIEGGQFELSYERLAATGWKLGLQSAHAPGGKGGKDPSKTSFVCSMCGQKAWGKPKLNVTCTPCLIGVLDAAGVDVSIVEPVRLKSRDSTAAPSPSYELNIVVAEPETTIAAEPAKPKRGRANRSKNKPKVKSYETKPAKPKRGRQKKSTPAEEKLKAA